MIKKRKDKRDFLFRVRVKRTSDGALKDLKRYVELEISWEGDEGCLSNSEGEMINFMEEEDNFDYKFVLKDLKLKSGLFKDKVVDWKLEPASPDEESIKVTTYWATRIEPSQVRLKGFVLVILLVFFAVIFGVVVYFWKKINKNNII